jgi:CubicO group peptidase (beta-lactamase class C family)
MNLKKLNEILSPYSGNAPGCALLILNSDKVEMYVEGFADLEEKRPVTSRSSFRLASVSKHFTALAILKLCSENKVSLDDSVTSFFPSFAAYGKDISLRNLLMHTSGLLELEELIEANADGQIRDSEVVRLLGIQRKGYFTPGTKFRYSDSGYCVLAQIVEVVSGLRFPKFMETKFFSPLGMTATCVNDEGKTKIEERAFGYSRTGGGWMRTDQNRTSATQGDGGIYSCLEDLVTWSNFLKSHNLLADKVLTDEEPAPTVYGYGMFEGKRLGRTTQHHRGSSIGFRSGIMRVPADDVCIVFLSNRNEGNGDEICEQVLQAKYDTIAL